MQALVVIDMLNDFVTGVIANPRSERIIPPLAIALESARAHRDDWLVVYANDAHLPRDFELAVWGEHAMAGSPGAAIVPQLAALPGDFILPKRTYSCFYDTGLEPLLRQYGVDTVVLTGQHSNMCVRHTAADAFFRGYRIVVPEDGVEAFSDEDQASGLAYLRQVYKAETPKLSDLL
jgi:nicotinamidase-related amidase